MKNKIKLLAALLAALSVFSLLGCGKTDKYADWPQSGTVYCYGENFSDQAQLDGNTSLSATEFKNLITGEIDTKGTTDPTNSSSAAVYIYEGEKVDSSKKVRTIKWYESKSISVINKILNDKGVFADNSAALEKDDVSSAEEIFTFELLNKDENGKKVKSNVFTLYLLPEEK